MAMPKKVETIAFSSEHLKLMDIREEEKQGIMSLDDVIGRFDAMSAASLDAKTFIYDGRIIFVAGFNELWPGVIECWMVPSIYVKTVRIEFCKILRRYVHDIMELYNCHRLQTSSPDDELHARWMKFLGLKREGLLRKFTHTGQDYVMYARTK